MPSLPALPLACVDEKSFVGTISQEYLVNLCLELKISLYYIVNVELEMSCLEITFNADSDPVFSF